MVDSSTHVAICKTMATCQWKFTDTFNLLKPDVLVVLGDGIAVFVFLFNADGIALQVVVYKQDGIPLQVNHACKRTVSGVNVLLVDVFSHKVVFGEYCQAGI